MENTYPHTLLATRQLDASTAYLQQAQHRATDGIAAAELLPISDVAIIGAGAMGRGIAMAMLDGGYTVSVYDASAAHLDSALNAIHQHLLRQADKKQLPEEWVRTQMARLSGHHQLPALAHCQLWVEAVPEDLALKCRVIQDIAAIALPEAILASNTSTLDIDRIAAASGRPGQVIGTHFFIPAQITRLLEVVPAKTTTAATLATIMQLAKVLKKTPVIAGNCDGFIGNRLFDRFHQEAMYLLEQGATPTQVDAALEQWGMAIGPFRALDMVGNDIPWTVRLDRQRENPQKVQPRIGDLLCEQGWYGQKTGHGWYHYDSGSRIAHHSEETLALIRSCADSLQIAPQTFTDAEIVSRCITAVVHEAVLILQQGYARRGSDIDVVFVNGYGFPAAVGGPVRLADALGLAQVAEQIALYAAAPGYSAPLWQSLPLLESLVAGQQSLSSFEV